MDFFVIVENGFKWGFINNLRWLNSITPLAFQFRNTVAGHKVLFEDGVFCEFAVFTLPELKNIPFARTIRLETCRCRRVNHGAGENPLFRAGPRTSVVCSGI
jgi:hypothetical protein